MQRKNMEQEKMTEDEEIDEDENELSEDDISEDSFENEDLDALNEDLDEDNNQDSSIGDDEQESSFAKSNSLSSQYLDNNQQIEDGNSESKSTIPSGDISSVDNINAKEMSEEYTKAIFRDDKSLYQDELNKRILDNIPLTNPVLDETTIDSGDDTVSRIDEGQTEESQSGVELPETEVKGITEPHSFQTDSPPKEETNLTKELRGLLTGYPSYINFENKEDTMSLVRDIILIYKLLYYCETKSKKSEVKEQLSAMREEMNEVGVPKLIEYYNEYISRSVQFGMARVRRRLDVFISTNISYIIELIQFFLFVMPYKGKKDMHLGDAHGLPANSAEDFERGEIEKGEKMDISLDTGFKLDDEGEVIPI